jgi:pimeloyl-ACP methyl ester carboxylesterase
MQELVDDLAVVVRAVAPNGEPVTVVGESFGGALAMSFSLARVAPVRGLVVLNSFPFFAPQFRLHLAIAGVSVMPWGAMTLVRAATAARMHSRFTHESEIQRFLQETRGTTRRGYLSRLRILRRYDVRARLQEINVPTLYIAADQDHLVPSLEQSRYMASRVPDATVHVLEGHGHICLIAPNVDLERIIGDWEHNADTQ